MRYTIEYHDGVEKQISKLKKGNIIAYNKLKKILPELMDHPRTGIGHPEPLRGYNNITWSRHPKKDRIIYDIYEDTVVVSIVQVGNHYDDK